MSISTLPFQHAAMNQSFFNNNKIPYLWVKIVLISSKSLIGRAQAMGVAKRNILLRFCFRFRYGTISRLESFQS